MNELQKKTQKPTRRAGCCARSKNHLHVTTLTTNKKSNKHSKQTVEKESMNESKRILSSRNFQIYKKK